MKTVPGQSPQKNFNSVLLGQNAAARARLPSTCSSSRLGVALACSCLLVNVCALPNPLAPFLGSGSSHSFLLHLMHFKKAVQQNPQWISVIFMILFLSAQVVSSYRPGGKLWHHQQPFAANEI